MPLVAGPTSLWACGLAVLILSSPLAGWLLPAILVDRYAVLVLKLTKLSTVAFNDVGLRSFLCRLSWADWMTAIDHWVSVEAPAPVRTVETVIILCLLVGYLWVVVRRRVESETVVVTSLALSLLTMSIVWSHYLVLAFPLLCRALVTPAASWRTRAAAAFGWILLLRHHHPLAPGFTTWGRVPGVSLAFRDLYALYYFVPVASILTVVVLLLSDEVRRTPSRNPVGERSVA
jgi:hypothetical protein